MIPPEDTSPDSEEYVAGVEDEMFLDWIRVGVAAGWISEPDCETHHGTPMRDWEEYAFDLGRDPCIVVARIWRDGFQHLTMADVVEAEGD